jgi:CRISPR-associated protein Cmr6
MHFSDKCSEREQSPVPFLVVKHGAEFLFAITATNEEWGNFTIELLKWCLQNIGIGGKTNAGYGYFAESKPIELKAEEDRISLAAQLAQSGHKVSTKRNRK